MPYTSGMLLRESVSPRWQVDMTTRFVCCVDGRFVEMSVEVTTDPEQTPPSARKPGVLL